MTTRSKRETVIFNHPFRIKGIEHELSAGSYEVMTDEELIESLSFPCFHRISTMITVPSAPPHRSSEMIVINPDDLSYAQEVDRKIGSEETDIDLPFIR